MRHRIALLSCGLSAVALVACLAPPARTEETAAPATFKNVKVLTGVTSKTEMRRIMKEQAAALGVKCVHCHVPGKFELDDKDEKKAARAMMTMVRDLNAKYFPDAKEPAVTCWTCHRGEQKPASPPPPPPPTDTFEPE